MRNRIWSKFEDKILIENYKKCSIKTLSKELNRTLISVQQRIIYLKNSGKIYKEKHKTTYSREENEYIIKNHNIKTIEEISKKLDRTPIAINQQIIRLKSSGKIVEKLTIKEVLKELMITKKDILKNRILNYEVLLIAEKLEISIEEVEKELEKMRNKLGNKSLNNENKECGETSK